MKYYSFFILALFVLIISSCDNEELNCSGIVYNYTIDKTPDSIMSADAHDFILDVSADDSREAQNTWKVACIAVLGVRNEWYSTDRDMSYRKCDTLYVQKWLKVYKIWKDGKYKLKVEMKENADSCIRGCKLFIGRGPKDKNSPVVAYGNYVDILQDSKSDDNESFAVNIRFKGKLHTSQATLDSNGNLVYQDNSFAQLMDSLSNAKDINAIVTESDVVDYYDSQDLQRNNTRVRLLTYKFDTITIENTAGHESPLFIKETHNFGGLH